MKSKVSFIVVFYKEAGSSSEPVREWIKALNKKEKKIVGHDLLVLQYNWPLGMPLVKNFGKGIWELRSTLGNRIARIFSVQSQDKIVLLHAFIKKTQKTPERDLELAQKRAKLIVV